MKKLILFVSSLLMSVSIFAATGTRNDKYVTKNYDLKDFTGIIASGIYEVELVKSDSWTVVVTVPEDLESYLDVRNKNGKLILGMKQVPLKVGKHYGNWTLSAKVGMPILKSLNLSGASKLECNDSFDLGDGTFKFEISGAAKAKGLEITAHELDMEMGGATYADFSGLFETAKIEMGGASKGNFRVEALRLDQELSGAAKAYHTGDFRTVDVEASGASVFSFEGKAYTMELEGSGAAKIETSKGSAHEVKASISGAASAEINALDTLVVEVSGGGSVRYIDNDGMKLDIRSVNRGASVTKMK